MTQTPEEMAAQYGPEGPVATARMWLEAILAKGDLDAAWRLTDLELKQTAVGAWYDANTSHPALAGEDRGVLLEALCVDEPNHSLWLPFATTQLREFRETWKNVDVSKWGWASHPRPLSPGYEIAMFVEAEGEAWTAEADMLVNALQIIVHHVPGTGWLVSGFAEPLAPAPD
jgi:hypothetical protein